MVEWLLFLFKISFYEVCIDAFKSLFMSVVYLQPIESLFISVVYSQLIESLFMSVMYSQPIESLFIMSVVYLQPITGGATQWSIQSAHPRLCGCARPCKYSQIWS